MTFKSPFKDGVLGVLHGKWQLMLKTPLFIRQGSKSAFKQQPKRLQKGRGQEVDLLWGNADKKLKEEPSEWSEISDFNYHFFVDEHNQLKVQYNIPASAIRGTLRQWAIKNLIKREDWRLFTLEKRDDKTPQQLSELMQKVSKHLQESSSRWADILSLFGSAYDLIPDFDNLLTWAGRLRLTAQIPEKSSNKVMDAGGKQFQCRDGPQNIKRHVLVQNPLDRVTMAAKEGGLHFGLEMSEGEVFEVEFHMLNPKRTDIEMLELWHTDIQAGFIRFGGLTSQGRGRVEISSEQYRLFVSSASALYTQIKKLGKKDLAENSIFNGIWVGSEQTRSELNNLDFAVLEK